MRFEVTVAVRYLKSSRLQTFLILAGVTVGILAYTFMAALINGLAENLTREVIGNIAHVTLEPREHVPRLLTPPEDARALVAVQRGNERRPEIEGWRRLARLVADTPGVVRTVPQVVGNGFVQRGEKIKPVQVTGIEAGKFSDIIDLGDNIVQGSLDPGPGEVVIGVKLARDFGLSTGQRIRLRSERGRERVLTVRAVFDVKSASINERVVFVDLGTAQNLMGLEGSVTEIAVDVNDIYAAPRIGRRLAAATGLEASDWIEENQRLQEALTSQANTGRLIKLFALVTIVTGVGSVLLVAAFRRKAEIGIMRSFGVKKRSIMAVFVLQGFLIGLVGSVLGAFCGWLFCSLLLEALKRPDGSPGLPVNPAQGEYLTAIVLATVTSSLSAILPARQAAQVDPVEVIQQ